MFKFHVNAYWLLLGHNPSLFLWFGFRVETRKELLFQIIPGIFLFLFVCSLCWTKKLFPTSQLWNTVVCYCFFPLLQFIFPFCSSYEICTPKLNREGKEKFLKLVSYPFFVDAKLLWLVIIYLTHYCFCWESQIQGTLFTVPCWFPFLFCTYQFNCKQCAEPHMVRLMRPFIISRSTSCRRSLPRLTWIGLRCRTHWKFKLSCFSILLFE